MSDFAISLKGVSKKYILHHEKPTLIENILGKVRNEEFWALKNINLEIGKGERVGIIGANGSGKTTLLKIIAGITSPSEGKVNVKGKIVSLIELEAGFHPELTGEENIFLNGLLVGMSKKDITRKFKQIVDFADLGSFIDAPFYTYSEGMKLRLGFSIVIHTDPDIILFDENLSVGDEGFKTKSQAKLRELFNNRKTMLLVSHNKDVVNKNCTKIVVLESGGIKSIRDLRKVKKLKI